MSQFDPPGRRPRRTDREQLKHDVLLGLAVGLPLTVVARRHEISQQAVDLWTKRDREFADEVAGARALGWDSLAVECLEIIDNKDDDVVLDNEGVPHFNTAAVIRDKARCDIRLRLLACWDPGRYNQQKSVKVEGEVQVKHQVVDPRQLDEGGRQALRALLAHAKAQGLLPGPEETEDAEFEEVLDPGEDVADG